jgi:hypothetical protein
MWLAGCKPIVYYLAQVCKVYGKVTVDGTDPAVPLGSVEVFVGDYQYSELTNYYGDYEMEMAEGTWTINFRKEGYETVTKEVTLPLETGDRRVRLDVSMVLIPPALIGSWTGTFTDFYGSPPLAITVEYSGDGTFTETITVEGTTYAFAGEWVQDSEAKTITIVFTYSEEEAIIPVGYTETSSYSFSADGNTVTTTSSYGTAVLTRDVS